MSTNAVQKTRKKIKVRTCRKKILFLFFTKLGNHVLANKRNIWEDTAGSEGSRRNELYGVR